MVTYYYFINYNKMAMLIKDNNSVKDIKVRHSSAANCYFKVIM